MKKTFLVLFAAFLAVLCISMAGCGLFGNSDNPDKPDGGDVFKLENATIGRKGGSDYYTGRPITFDVILYNGKNEQVAEIKAGEQHPELNVVFTDNVEVGTAKVTVTAKSGSKKFSGQTEMSFDIRPDPKTAYVGDFVSLKKYLEGGRYAVLELTAEVEIPEGEKIEIASNTKLCLGGFDLVNNGEIINRGTFVVGGSMNNSGNLINHGKFVNTEDAKFTFDSYGGIIHDGQLENHGKFDKTQNNYFDVYVYADAEINVEFPYFVRVCNRVPMSDESVVLKDASMPYTGNAIIPSLAWGEVGKDYEITCEQNVNAGTYFATFTATKCSKYYTGQTELSYMIAPIAYKTTIESAFLKAVQSPNYNVITYNPENRNTKPKFSLLEGVTLNIADCDPTIENIASGVTVNFNDFCTLTVKNIGENATLNFGRYCDIVALADQTVTLGSNAKLKVKDGNSDTKRNRLVVLSNVAGEGSIDVGMRGELFFGSNVTSVGVPIENAGIVYSNFELNNVTNVQYGTLVGTEVVRRQLTEADVTVTNPEYTGENVKVAYAFDNRDDGNSALYYKYDGVVDETRKVLPKEVGDYQAELRFSDTDKNYFGVFEFDFKVAKGVYRANDSSKLMQAIESGNYDRYVISGNWWNSDTLELPAGETFTAKATFTNNGVITVNGTLEIEKGINRDSKSLTVKEGGKLVINGSFFNSENAELTIESGATVQNNGTVYLCAEDFSAISGNKILRKPLAEATFTVTDPAVYKTKPAPTFELRYGDNLIDESAYVAIFSNNSYRTAGNDATATVTAKTDDVNYYGSATYAFPVLGGEINVSNNSALYSALNDVAANGLCNYATITTSWSFSIMENDDGTVADFSVREGTTLAVKHNVGFYDSAPNFAKYNLKNDGVIEIYGSARLRYANKWQENGSGTFKLIASEASHFDRTGETPYYDEIILEKDIDLGASGSLKIYASANGTTVNLNNHKISVSSTRSVTIYTRGNEITVTSGRIEGKVVISREDVPSLNVEPAGKVILRNLTITKEITNELNITVEMYNVT